MPSQNKQRIVAKNWSGDEFEVEYGPFLFEVPGHKGRYEVHTAPWVYVKHLPSPIESLLCSLKK